MPSIRTATQRSDEPVLDRLIPAPRSLEVDHVELAASPERAWELLRHGDLARSPLVRALFALRGLPEALSGRRTPSTLSVDDLRSSPERPGFSVLLEHPPRSFAVGAIGKVWHATIPFVHIADAQSFADFDEPDFVKVAWEIRVVPQGERCCRVELEVRVDATDDEAWRKFERYFVLIGPGSHFIRRALLTSLEREFGSPDSDERARSLPGDGLLADAQAEASDGITIAARPEQIWPWLGQMGGQRAGFYGLDWLDNGGMRSSREIIPQLQNLAVGQILPATPEGPDGFEVLAIDAPRSLVLGGLYDVQAELQLPFTAVRPERYWHMTWAFVLEPLDAGSTRLHVRARAAFPPTGKLHAAWIRPVHHLLQRRMLSQLRARAEGTLPTDDARDIATGMAGAAVMIACFVTPFARHARSHWGVNEADADAARPGDELVPSPAWSWTHGVKIHATAELVWSWVAQIGADRAGFYSYQWLENLAGCGLRNADAVHQDWELQLGDELVLHPRVPPLRIVALERARHLVAHAAADEAARQAGKTWASASWLFQLESLADGQCRLVTRYRVACSPDITTRLAFGPTLLETIGFAMDRRMLLGIRERAERAAHYALATSRSSVSSSSATLTGFVK